MTDKADTPNAELGKVVVETLVSEGLIITDQKETILSKICDGKMTLSEWKSCIEMKILKGEGKLKDGKSDQQNRA